MIQKAKLPLVGIRIPEWATFTRNIFAGVVDHMREHRRWHIETPLVTFSEMHPVRIDENWTGDGLIVFRYTPEEAESWMKRGVKVVNFSSECIDPRIPTVIPDNFESGRLAAIHLMGLGLKRFAFWEDPGRVYSRERLAGFSKELARNNFTCDVIGVLSCEMPLDRRADLVAAAMDRQLVKLPKPIGIFAKDDMAAMELIFSCQRLGITVPDEVAMIGCNDDFIFCYTADIPVSSVRYPARLIGYRAAAQLAALFGGATGLPARTIVPVEGVVVRESTDILLYGHPLVREAVGIIRRETPSHPLRVQEVLDAMFVSKTSIQDKFRKEVGVTMKEYIDRVRTDTVRNLLVRTSLPIKIIAEEMRFESQEELSRFFKRTGGTAPSEYRRLHRSVPDVFFREEEG